MLSKCQMVRRGGAWDACTGRKPEAGGNARVSGHCGKTFCYVFPLFVGILSAVGGRPAHKAAGCVARSALRAAIRHPDFVCRRVPSGTEKPPEPRIFRFSTLRETSLRQEICVFAERNFFLSAKKFHFCRTKSAAVPEKCIIRAFLRRFSRRFLTFPFRKHPFRICDGKGKMGFSFRFDSGWRVCADILSVGIPCLSRYARLV